jgi:DNA-3-methyladenine glycosylase
LSDGRDSVLLDSFFLRDAATVARDLLGTCFRSTVGGAEVLGVVVETEAYVGPHDPASHAAKRIGRTVRNESMYGPPGQAYVYRSYGIHWCLNVVTGEEGFPAAVLIRGLDPVEGLEPVKTRRKGRKPLCAGPGRLCEALGVTGALDRHPLRSPPLELLRGWDVSSELVAVSGRVGIRRAADWPLRFYLRGHPQVSRGPRKGAAPSTHPGNRSSGTETETEPDDV